MCGRGGIATLLSVDLMDSELAMWGGSGVCEAVGCVPSATDIATIGTRTGWSIVTQPDCLQYPAYETYPIETAVQVVPRNLVVYILDLPMAISPHA